jgi:hypothetical protein
VLKQKGGKKQNIAAAALIYTKDIFQAYVHVPEQPTKRKKRRIKQKDENSGNEELVSKSTDQN